MNSSGLTPPTPPGWAKFVSACVWIPGTEAAGGGASSANQARAVQDELTVQKYSRDLAGMLLFCLLVHRSGSDGTASPVVRLAYALFSESQRAAFCELDALPAG